MSAILDQYLKEKLPFSKTLAKYVKTSDIKTIFEVGSCESEDSIKLSRYFSNATTFCFEPIPDNVKLARAHIEKYKAERLCLFEIALSDSDGYAKFFVSSGQPEDAIKDPEWNYGNKSSSLLKPNFQKGQYDWLKFKKKLRVKTERIDTFCKKHAILSIDLLHIDVQGAELMVLQGAGPLLKSVKAIWLEVEAVELYKDQPLRDAVEKFMKKAGFTCVLSTVDHVSGDQLYVANKLARKS